MWSVLGLGIIQGLTEFLPISSSGHLIVMKSLFGVSSPGAALEVALHAGTLVAVLWAYRHWIGQWARDLRARQRAAWQTLGALTVASVPAGLAGLFMGRLVEHFFIVPAVVVGWLCTALLLWAMPAPDKTDGLAGGMTWTRAILIGLAQALALWPGLSRSGSTIAMGRAVGLAPEDAARFSFLLAIPAVAGASLFEVPALADASLPGRDLAAGALLAAITGVIAIQWVKGLVNRPRAWRGFSIYMACAALAAWIFGG